MLGGNAERLLEEGGVEAAGSADGADAGNASDRGGDSDGVAAGGAAGGEAAAASSASSASSANPKGTPRGSGAWMSWMPGSLKGDRPRRHVRCSVGSQALLGGTEGGRASRRPGDGEPVALPGAAGDDGEGASLQLAEVDHDERVGTGGRSSCRGNQKVWFVLRGGILIVAWLATETGVRLGFDAWDGDLAGGPVRLIGLPVARAALLTAVVGGCVGFLCYVLPSSSPCASVNAEGSSPGGGTTPPPPSVRDADGPMPEGSRHDRLRLRHAAVIAGAAVPGYNAGPDCPNVPMGSEI